MNKHILLVLTLVSGLLAGAGLNAAESGHDHEAHDMPMSASSEPAPSGGDHEAWLAAAKAAYPLSTCVVSSDELADSGMGKPIDYVHHEKGKPDRLVRFCCRDCVRDFKKDPAKYLAMIDAATAKKAGSEESAEGAHEGHSGHDH